MSTDFNTNALTSSGGFKPSTKDTPIDIRSRVATESDILNIPNPYIGMLVYVLDSGKRFEVLSLKEEQSGLSTVSKVDQYQEFAGNSGANGILDEMIILTPGLHYGDTLPEPGNKGRIFFLISNE